jgi:succinoglycan biosynthesis transport protein ExoP
MTRTRKPALAMVELFHDSTDPSDDSRPTAGRLIPAAQAMPVPHSPYGQASAYGGSAPEFSGTFNLDLQEYFRILVRRKWLILSIAGAFLALGIVRTLVTTPLYTAAVRLQIDRNVAKIVEGGNVTPVEGSDFEFLRTQYELLQSRTIAERVASALKLGEDPAFLKPKEFSIMGALMSVFRSNGPPSSIQRDKKAREHVATGIVLANRGVRPVAGSRLVDLIYTDAVPSRAQRIATAYADAFIAANLDKRFQANAYAKTFLEDQLKQLKLRLEESEKVLLEFAQKEQIVAVTEKASIAENNLASANAALGNLVSERIKNEQLWRQVETVSGITLPQLLTNSVVDGLRGKRNALVADYQEKLETFKPGFPAMVQISNKITEIDRQLATEVKIIKASLKAAYESSLGQEAEMKKRIESLRAEVLDLQKRSIEYNILKREVDTTRSLYEGLLQRYKEVDVAGGVGANNIFVVDRAELPGAPSSPQISRSLLLTLIIGLVTGLAAAFVLERLDDTVRSAEEIERISGLPTLGIIPKVDPHKTVETELAEPRSHLSEAYRSLCTALQFSTESGLPKAILVTSTASSEGKSVTSLAVARHFATMGLKVLLIDADLRNPSLHKKLGLENGLGLSNYLTGGCTPPEAFQTTATPNLIFMASGPLPPNAADLLGNSRLRSLFSIGLEVFDLIIIDGPPILGLADALLLSSAAAATMFVTASGQARTALVRGALKRLQLARASVIGATLTKFDAKAARYGNDYGYGYAYGDDAQAYGQAALGFRGRLRQLASGQESA